MEIVIDTSGSVPVFAQIIAQIKKAILNDDLKGGMHMPSIRQLANDLQLNHNTVAKAYRLLERDAVIETKGYRGTFIHPNAKANSTVDLNQIIISKLSDVIETVRAAGATDSEIRIAFNNVMKQRSN